MNGTEPPTFECSPADQDLIDRIVQRCAKLVKAQGFGASSFDALGITMDLTACHGKTPLDLQALLDSRDADFGHDIGGIRQHLDRTTGELTDCFWPRCGGRN